VKNVLQCVRLIVLSALLCAVGVSVVGHSQTASVENKLAISQSYLSPGTVMPPPTPPPGGQDQLLVDGRPVRVGDDVSVRPGQTVNWEVLCASAEQILLMFFIKTLVLVSGGGETRNIIDAQLFLMALGIGILCSRHFRWQGELRPEAVMPASVTLQLQQGAARFTVANSLVGLDIQTATTTVQSEGMNDFSVGYNPNTGTSVVAVHAGAVRVEPTNSNLPSMTLSAGVQVQVTGNEIGPITPIGSGRGTAPSITSASIPSTLTINTPTLWQVGFTDADGDVSKIRFEQFVDGAWQPAGEFDPNVQSKTKGSIAIETTCKALGTIRSRVTLFDAGGNSSDPREYSFECVSSTIPPPSGGKTIEETLDANNNKVLDDLEMLQALQYWIKGQAVPGTNKPIDDLKILSLLQMWIKGTSVRTSSAASILLEVRKLAIQR
jgi:hypothetical protein